jgi:hypothetical protein
MRSAAGRVARSLVVGLAALVLVGALLGAVGPSLAAGSAGHSGAPVRAPSAVAASPTPAAQAQTATGITIGIVYTPGLTFPGNVTFWTNISKGAISNATTFVWVTVNGTGTGPARVSLNATVNAHKIVSFTNNGILYENYTWLALVTSTTLACAVASCASLIGASPSGSITFNVTVKENGASEGGGWATSSYAWTQTMVSTFVTVGFSTPKTNLTSGQPYTYDQALPFAITFWTNTSYVLPSNSTLFVNLTVTLNTVHLVKVINLSAPPSALNTTNSLGYSSFFLFNGKIAGAPWDNVSWSLVLNYTSLGFANQGQLAGYFGTGGTLNLTPSVTAEGASAGGINAAPQAPFVESMMSGTTLIYGGTTDQPVAYQPLPYTETGWVNLSWVSPNYKANGNTTVTGFLQLFGATLLKTFSANDSVNTVNAYNVSLLPYKNGSTRLGVTYTNYTWSVEILSADLGASPYGDLLTLSLNLTVVGVPVDGVTNYLSVPDLFVAPTAFVEHPTVVTVTASTATPITGFINVPYNLNFTIAVTNGTILASVTSVSVSVVDPSLPVGPAAIGTYPVAVTDNQTKYTYPITAASTVCTTTALYDGFGLPVCDFTVPTDDFYFTITVVENGIGAPTNGSVATNSVNVGPAFFISSPAKIALLAPSGTTLSIGNVTFVTLYSGQYVSGATVTVFLGATTVFSAAMTQLTPGVPAISTWPATAAGTYNLSVKLVVTSGPAIYINKTLTMVQSGVTETTSTYHNVTLLGTLSPAVAGTLLLVVGLLVGMIVALLAGRMVWGAPRAPPPTPWSPTAPEKPEGEAPAGPTEGPSTPPPS